MRSIFLPLALAGCATVANDLSTPQASSRRTLWIENRTPDALVVRVDGVRAATVLSQRGACIRLPAPGQTLTARAIGHTETWSAPAYVDGHAQAWSWRIRPALESPGATLDLQPGEPCRAR